MWDSVTNNGHGSGSGNDNGNNNVNDGGEVKIFEIVVGDKEVVVGLWQYWEGNLTVVFAMHMRTEYIRVSYSRARIHE